MNKSILFAALVAFLTSSAGAIADDTKGLMGFSYTQDNIFISHTEGSSIANIPIYGWGSFWPFSEAGKESDNGDKIDKRVKQAIADGQEVVLTCATAPAMYRASGKPWNMEERVMDSMEDQYAHRCAEAVVRWPQITRVQVWNELKGYWLMPPANRWDYEGYTRFYNKVYDAIKAVRPEVKVGGGYAALNAERPYFVKKYDGVPIDFRAMDAMIYWLGHAKGYDAVCLDGSLSPEAFPVVADMFRKLSHNKPIWWAEFYSGNPAHMHEARELIRKNMQSGDIALWWAADAFEW